MQLRASLNATILAMNGQQPPEVVTLQEVRTEFDKWLSSSPPKPEKLTTKKRHRLELEAALGVGGSDN